MNKSTGPGSDDPKKLDALMRRLGIRREVLSGPKSEGLAGKGVLASKEDIREFIGEMALSMKQLAQDAELHEMANDLDIVWRRSLKDR